RKSGHGHRVAAREAIATVADLSLDDEGPGAGRGHLDRRPAGAAGERGARRVREQRPADARVGLVSGHRAVARGAGAYQRGPVDAAREHGVGRETAILVATAAVQLDEASVKRRAV